MRYPQIYTKMEEDLNVALSRLPNRMTVVFVRRSAVLDGLWTPDGLRMVADTLDKLQSAYAESNHKNQRKDSHGPTLP